MKRCDTSMSNPPGRDRAGGLRCTCGAVVSADSFRDRISYREHARSGWCQACQDDFYFRPSADDARVRYPIRRGVLAAPAVHDGSVVELALLPFICIVPEARVEWEARFLLRAGAERAPLELACELGPMQPALATHQVRLTEVDDVGGVEVRAALDADLAVVRDAAAREALGRLPLGTEALCLALADEVPQHRLCGETLPSPCASPGAGGVSVLRACARIAVALAGRPPGTFEPLRTLLRAHPGRFPELDGASSDGC